MIAYFHYLNGLVRIHVQKVNAHRQKEWSQSIRTSNCERTTRSAHSFEDEILLQEWKRKHKNLPESQRIAMSWMASYSFVPPLPHHFSPERTSSPHYVSVKLLFLYSCDSYSCDDCYGEFRVFSNNKCNWNEFIYSSECVYVNYSTLFTFHSFNLIDSTSLSLIIFHLFWVIAIGFLFAEIYNKVDYM